MIKIETVIKEQGKILNTSVGNSMWPMLHSRQEQLIVEPITKPLRINDVVLFKRSTGQYVLHRIIKIRPQDFVMRGDNCINSEYGITEQQIIGVLRGFYRKDKYIDCFQSNGYKAYVFAMRLYSPVWIFFKKIFICLKKNLIKICSGSYTRK